MPPDRKVLDHNLRKKTFGQNFNPIPFRWRSIDFFKFDTPLNSKFSSIKSGRNNLSNEAVAELIYQINTKLVDKKKRLKVSKNDQSPCVLQNSYLTNCFKGMKNMRDIYKIQD